MMRIALVVPREYYAPDHPAVVPYASTAYFHGLAHALEKKGHDVTILCQSTFCKSLDIYVYDGIKVVGIPWSNSARDYGMQVHAWLLENSMDVVESTQFRSPLLVEQLAGGTPTVVRLESTFLEEVASGQADFGDKRKLEWSEHVLSCYSISRANQVLCSNYRHVDAASQYNDRLRVVAPGVCLEDLPADIERERSVLILVSRFGDFRKGGELVAELIRRIPPGHKVVVLGASVRDSREMTEIRAAGAAATDLEIRYMSADISELAAYFSTARYVIVPARDLSFGYALLEPMACGTPVLCFDQTDKYRSAWPLWNLGTWGSPEAMSAIPRVIQAIETEGYDKVSQTARDFVAGFSWDRVVDQHLSVYSQAIAHSLLSGRTRGW